jgi:hypothetical protein
LLASVALVLGCASVPGPTARIHGHVTVAPCRPVERPGDPPCPPATGVRIDFDATHSTLTDARGDYSALLPAGSYDVVVEAGIGRRPVHVTLAPGTDVTQDFNIDSGIR